MLTPVDLMVIQWALSHFLAGNVIVPRLEPAATRMVSPHAAALTSACTAAVVESGPRTVPGDGVPLTGVYMQFTGMLAGPSVAGPDQVPEGEQ